MTLASAALRFLHQNGLTIEHAIELAEALEFRGSPSSAERQRRYRQRLKERQMWAQSFGDPSALRSAITETETDPYSDPAFVAALRRALIETQADGSDQTNPPNGRVARHATATATNGTAVASRVTQRNALRNAGAD